METATLAMVRENPPAEPSPGFRELYDRHSRAVFLAALRVTGNPADAEDVLQTVFLRVFDRQLELDAVRITARFAEFGFEMRCNGANNFRRRKQ